ncbi:MAG: ribonuclease P protein component [Candidatus Doudnabacteria bacterium RIFCSPHIGHO2_02_FULL_48_21]|uniref:Ribonuclease P protein component n=1 Tax=Candidatus Doudnabacteria bacterium RIFCSPLOWO2_02_FULL_48_13 TaxID=1817845 RepID=A0A1F5QCE6_9BACT|nr:MAG: ribonuclease P protein component [Candidatus Doudnabacteria bacterium RIFCSPHIGHO2_01_48_18]OGE79683.1 MAG: ribonuclease P protein component [Candidatus Doudnabacteria bacterium RIFCSPHIGHO2_01_FULL_48_180]OGE91484.1 MAG: ribonuclease P protein component [Candidatus Doudnabacteria bacterium RIFCSPHIGHO2_12_FULL_47_25]OGE93098.1 MAG: ribonuclease P protein component [Candidatus Doudnabacteria bacterium RIFCSPHIGHO2_02_FULL_48_21]OGE98105.1 MAG: ribonuclease P protein component [Candidatu
MLPASFRLTQEKDFALIYKKGRRVQGRSLRIIVARSNQNVNRFGFVVSKKDLPLSTQRNRLKRILRDEVRVHIKAIKAGHDIVIQGRGGAKHAPPSEIRAELIQLIRRLGLIT